MVAVAAMVGSLTMATHLAARDDPATPQAAAPPPAATPPAIAAGDVDGAANQLQARRPQPHPSDVDLTPATSPPADPSATDRADRAVDTAAEAAERLAGTQRPEHRSGPTSPEGYQVAEGTSRAGDDAAVTYTVELEHDVEVDISDLVEVVEAALHDPRSWANDHTLERIDDPSAADIRLVLATPATVDELCRRAGLNTNGIFSCWNGHVAALNAMRWVEGAAGFGDDIEGYRTYLVNHEFGHGLGYGHVGCPTAGAPAPVMMQQTRTTDACLPNGWPYPGIAPARDDTGEQLGSDDHGGHDLGGHDLG